MNNDQKLWQKLKRGDKSALADIYAQQVDALFRYGCQFTRDEGLVEDCIQDLFIELWKNRNSIGHTTAIRQYLLVSLRRKIVRQLQQSSQRQEKAVLNYQLDEVEGAPDQTLITTESRQLQEDKMAQALAQLSERQREIIYLKYFESLNYKQIAEMLDINHQSVRNTASAGLKTLRKLLMNFLVLYSTLSILNAL